MKQQVTLQVADNVLLYAKTVATQTQRRIEEVLSDWLEKIPSDFRVENLSDAEVVALTKLQLSTEQQNSLADLQEKNSEGNLSKSESAGLDALMEIYNQALLKKAQAFRIAVERGLIEPLSE